MHSSSRPSRSSPPPSADDGSSWPNTPSRSTRTPDSATVSDSGDVVGPATLSERSSSSTPAASAAALARRGPQNQHAVESTHRPAHSTAAATPTPAATERDREVSEAIAQAPSAERGLPHAAAARGRGRGRHTERAPSFIAARLNFS